MTTPQIHRAMQQAVALHQAGRLAEAERIYRDVLAKDARNADALQLLGLLEHQRGQHDRAIEMIRKAITIRPQPEFYINLAQAYRAVGRVQDSLEATQRAVQMSPNIPEGWNNLGSILKELYRLGEAENAFRKAIALRPSYAVAHSNLGNTLAALNRANEAHDALRQAIVVDPTYAEGYSNLSHFLAQVGRLDEAVMTGTQAMQLKPNLAAAYSNVGTALQLQGYYDLGNEAYAQGARIEPTNARMQENLLGGANYTTRVSPAESLAAHVRWAETFAPSAASPRHTNDRNPERKLRIGYVSPDFKRHSVAYFLEPILDAHDRERFEITAYSNTEMPDDVTERLRGKCDRWRDIIAVEDARVAEQIRADGIDILVDLAGHTTGNRLAVLGRKPAPVQMTYLGYPNTTGVAAIDYRVTDHVTDPPGETDAHYSEKLIRLPAPFLAYRAPAEHSPDVVEPPSLKNAFVTFGSFNKASKVGPETISLWAKVLNAIPTSRLLLKSRGLGDGGSQRRLFAGFSSLGVARERVELIEANQSLRDHLANYGRVDLALDTFPYHGTTTTCEAMWMGVSVVSRVGVTHVSRVGLSLLRAVGEDDLATDSDEAFVSICARLSSDPQGLRERRLTLRSRLSASPLCDAARLTRNLELWYRQAFATWAASPT